MSTNDTTNSGVPRQPFWMIYIALFVAGVILLMDALGMHYGRHITFKLGVAFLFSAIAFMFARKRQAAYWAAGILWVAVILSFVV